MDGQGNITVAGATNSPDFCVATPDAVSSKLNGGGSTAPPPGFSLNVGDGFIARFSSSGTMTYCSFIGGDSYDALGGLTVDSAGNVYATGLSISTNFPTTANVLGKTRTGEQDAIVVKLGVAVSPTIGSVVGAGLSVPAVNSLSANGLFTLFGTSFADPAVSRNVTGADLMNNALPTNLANTCVQGGNARWGLIYVSATQINAVADPLTASGTVPISVVRNCGQPNETASAPVNVKVGIETPQFLFFIQNPSGQNEVVAIEASNGAKVGPPGLIPGVTFTPARAGDILTVYCVGLGPTKPAAVIGSLAGGAADITGGYKLTVGGKKAIVSYAGLTPTYAGLYQINFTVPAGLSAGNQPIVFTVNGVSTPEGAFLAVE